MPITANDIENAVFLADAAYQNSQGLLAYLSGSDWQALGSDPVPSGPFQGEQLPAPEGVPSVQWDLFFGEGIGDSNFLFDNGNSQAFVARSISEPNTVAIAFRGTNSKWELPQVIGQGATTFLFDYDEFQYLIESLTQYIAENEITRVLVTGHSLGGAMAEWLMASDLYLPGVEFVGVTFGSPGDAALSAINDTRLINFGHTEDPVFNSAQGWSTGPRDVGVDLTFVNTAGDLFAEHSLAIQYNFSAQKISSSPLFEFFVIDPASYHVTLGLGGTLHGVESVQNFIVGGGAPNTIFGKNRLDLLDGGGGDDTIRGGLDGDDLHGGIGADYLYGESGEDSLHGGEGNDALFGGGANDIIFGGPDYDTVFYDQNFNQYNLVYHQNGNTESLTISPKPSALQSEGTDNVYQVENIVFADGPKTWQQMVLAATGGTSGGSGNGGTYDPNPSPVPGDFPNNTTTPTSAFLIPYTSSTTGIPIISAIETPGDTDYVRVYLQQGITYRVLVEGTNVAGYGSLPDTFFRIRDGRDLSVLQPSALPPTNGNSHDQVVGLNAQLDFYAPYTGLYFISVGGGGPSFDTLTGGYRVTATIIGSPPSNQNPVANNDGYIALYGHTISGNVLANDSDPNGNALGTDVINGHITSLGGIVTLLSSGVFQYTAPASGFSGQADSFAYVVRDGAGGSAVATVEIILEVPQPALPTFTENSDIVTLPNFRGPYYGHGGNDVFTISAALGSTVFGGQGDDTFIIAGGTEHDLIGGPNNDLFIAGPGGAEIWGDEIASDYGSVDTIDFSAAGAGLRLELYWGGDYVSAPGIGPTSYADIENYIASNYWDIIRINHSDNIVWALAGDDYIEGRGGSDTLYGGSGNDEISGDNILPDENGDDNLYGEAGMDSLKGRLGNDLLDGGADADTLEGGAGNDILNGGDGDDGVYGEEGDDHLIASAGTDDVRGMDGFDTLDFSNAPSGLSGAFQHGGYISVAGWGTTWVYETEALIASPFADSFNVYSVAEVHLRAGADFCLAQTFAIVFGDDGDDLLLALQDARFFGGVGNDTLNSAGSNAEFYGEAGDDRIYGSETGEDRLDGGIGHDQIVARNGDDEVIGGEGNDLLEGNDGIDQLDGGTGNDNLIGGDDGDVLIGGVGDDTLTGGSEADIFRFSFLADLSANTDHITDFGLGLDTIDLSAIAGLQFIGSAAFSGSAGQVRYQFENLTTHILIDSNGDSATDKRIVIDNGKFAFAETFAGSNVLTVANVTPPITSDFNGDGKSDVLWQNEDGRAAVWLVNGTTVLDGAVVGSNPGPAWHIKGTGDFDQNDRLDIVWQHNDGRVAIWFLDGTTLAGSGIIASNPGQSWHVIDTGHFNADGKSDLLWQNDDGRAAVWTLDGATQIGAAVVGGNPGLSWNVKASGDFNGDGESDILWQNIDGRAGIWMLDGMNFVDGAVAGDNPGPSWRIKDSGDFNGDGKSDILWQNDDGRAAIWLVDGLSLTSGSVVGSNPGPAWQAESAADYNGDGKSDILWQHSNGQAAVWLMDGAGVVNTSLLGSNPGPAWHVDWI